MDSTGFTGWTLADPTTNEGGFWFVMRPDGTKYGQTQTEAAARNMRVHAARSAKKVEDALGARETQADRDAWYDMDR